ncbi:pyroglutamyl-peptidase I [Anaerococcus lactolyticus ATCC 51172]|uniref:Pyrrolidone-carboxylate peptidase n=1 Tax=Anaerococcus lactolyticus ATCC 51172 TaxID=525254 RepID=C2BI99_9FIRM|nr:pyroglutamyl-peptidase I [Anaerococcus lactolyticus]EEI85393.1 pyroglutamyl-peptidase I [Anaerococcus lactolyticus ATCC 51172]
MKILITGFDAFGGEKINPASLILDRLPDKINGNKIEKLTIPTAFFRVADLIERKIVDLRPDIVISLGQAGGRSDITVERVAINIADASIADNDGKKPIDEKIRWDGENAYFSTLPIKALVENLRKNNIPASVSNSAGTFVCNFVMYNDLYFASKYKNISAGFIHVPYLPAQVIDKKGMASMSLDEMVRAVEIIIKTSADYKDKEDLKRAEGRIC